MDFAVISRGDVLSEKRKGHVIDVLTTKGYTHNQAHPQMVIVVGGDGTVLRAFHTYQAMIERVCFIAYNTGHLGFYSEWDDVDALLKAITEDKLITVEYPLVQVELTEEQQTRRLLALNDFTVKGIRGSVQVDVELNNRSFESFKGDGLCISSPSGSTGYNKSLGGAIVHPSLEMIQLSEIASINNRVYRTIGSSLVIPKGHTLTLHPQPNTYTVSVDHATFQTEHLQKVTCSVATERIQFLRCESFPFWSRVKEAFIALDCPKTEQAEGE
ncbi:NAD kinase [Ammoniphilus oxalaticus]|uniref:NAD kinase n=1 Tax=Ammoniphilus oxalaticus TaxID=66863 RepID=A0A419SK57_9BACL|nr:NAD kinase [Ammoniphilus oxalaticus]RKD24319.1 NAD kinase [Ammoniphilus oxalaticus]